MISEGITHGGYKTIDDRYICSLCYPNLIYDINSIEISRVNVIRQLEKVGFNDLIVTMPNEMQRYISIDKPTGKPIVNPFDED